MKVSKLIVGILAVQTAMIILLTYVVFTLESRTGELAYEIAAARLSSQPSPNSDHPNNIVPTAGLNASDARQIIREELNILAEGLGSTERHRNINGRSKPPISEEEIVGIHAEAATQIRSMASFGLARPQDIAKFEDTIVNLPAKEREAAMREFMKAINQGDIQAKF